MFINPSPFSRLRTVSLGETDKMELEDEESSSSLSSSEWEDVDNCPEAGEADDEQSDWFTEPPGPVYGVPVRVRDIRVRRDHRA